MTVHVDGRSSRPARITRGVPQGSPLGPLLFSIYYADVAAVFKSNCVLFADDTEIHAFGESPEDVARRLNDILLELKR